MRIRVLTGSGLLLLCAMGLAQTASKPQRADRVVILKKERTLQLLSHGKVIKTYKVALGGDPVGAKTRQGDHKTPEGLYVLDSRNAHSQFYKSLHISYPSARDRAAAKQKGVSPGGKCSCMGYRTATGGWEPGTGRRIGRMDALRSLIRRSTRSGSRWRTGRPLRFGPEIQGKIFFKYLYYFHRHYGTLLSPRVTSSRPSPRAFFFGAAFGAPSAKEDLNQSCQTGGFHIPA
jgi:hypothetical protein